MIKFTDLADNAPDNLTILDALGKCHQMVNNHRRIMASVSGGYDSDIMLDLIIRTGGKEKTTFVFFSTGLEYEATKKQIQRLNKRYGIEIQEVPPVKPIPKCVRDHGVPFWSKHVSEMIERLQSHDFQWEDEPLEVLLEKYPNCKSALRWWCNDNGKDGKTSQFDIGYIKWLKEFLITSPPTFRISNKCCYYAKKLPAKKYAENMECDMNCVGVRKGEGGVRAARYSSCYTAALAGPDQYRPVFWFSDADKAEYSHYYGVLHSDCYALWGMQRTGCAGCPFGRNYEEELAMAKKWEPKFYRAMCKIFGPSYEYRRQFEAFRETMNKTTLPFDYEQLQLEIE